MSVPQNPDGTPKALEIHLPTLKQWRRKDFKRFIRMFEGGVTAEKMDDQDQFIVDHSNYTQADIDDLDTDEYGQIFKAFSDFMQETAVPKANGEHS